MNQKSFTEQKEADQATQKLRTPSQSVAKLLSTEWDVERYLFLGMQKAALLV